MPRCRASLPKRPTSGKHHKRHITRSISDGNDNKGHPSTQDRDEVDTVREEEDDSDAVSVRSCPDAKRGGRSKKSPYKLSRRIQSDSRARPFLYDIAEDQEEEVRETSSLQRQIENVCHQDDEEFDRDNVGVEILHSSSESSSCMQLDEIIDNTMSADSCSNDMYSLSDAAMAINLSPTELSMLSAMSAATEKAGNVTTRINTSVSTTPSEELRTTLAKTMKELEKVDISVKAAEARKRAGLRVFYDPKASQYPDKNAALMMAESSDSYDLHNAFNVLTGFVTNFNFSFHGKGSGNSSHNKTADKGMENMVFM